jgi:putative ABC transport system ATP-binding protein
MERAVPGGLENEKFEKTLQDFRKHYMVHNMDNTIIMVTHNEAIKNMADHVIKLRDGAVRHNERNEHKISAADLEW